MYDATGGINMVLPPHILNQLDFITSSTLVKEKVCEVTPIILLFKQLCF